MESKKFQYFTTINKTMMTAEEKQKRINELEKEAKMIFFKLKKINKRPTAKRKSTTLNRTLEILNLSFRLYFVNLELHKLTCIVRLKTPQELAKIAELGPEVILRNPSTSK